MKCLHGLGLAALLSLGCASAFANSDTNTNTVDRKVLQEYNRPNVSDTIVTTNKPVKFNEGNRDYVLQVLSSSADGQRAKIRISTGWRSDYEVDAVLGKDYEFAGLTVRFFGFWDDGVEFMRTSTK